MGKNFTAKEICRDRGIDIVFNKRDHDFSSTELRKRIWAQESAKITHYKKLQEGEPQK
jgi:glycerol-3-phosphate cytidylyltransferase